MKFVSYFLCAGLLVTVSQYVSARVPKPIRKPQTLTCVTGDMSPNVDIRVAFNVKDAVVTLVTFGNDVDDAPTTGPSAVVSTEVATLLVEKNTGIIAFFNAEEVLPFSKASLLALDKGDGYIAIPTESSNEVHPVLNCRVK